MLCWSDYWVCGPNLTTWPFKWNSSPVLWCCPTFGFVYKRILDLKLVNSSGTTTNRGMLAFFIFILITATLSPPSPPRPIPQAHCFLPNYNPTNQIELEKRDKKNSNDTKDVREKRKEIKGTKWKTGFIPRGFLLEILGVCVPLGPGPPYPVKEAKICYPLGSDLTCTRYLCPEVKKMSLFHQVFYTFLKHLLYSRGEY